MKSVLTAKEFYFLSVFLSKFKSCEGSESTVNKKAIRGTTNFLKVLLVVNKKLLDRFFLFNSEENLREKMNKFFSRKNTQKGQKCLKVFYKNQTKNEIKNINDFSDFIFNAIINDSLIYQYAITIEKMEDLVQGKYTVSNVGICFFLG